MKSEKCSLYISKRFAQLRFDSRIVSTGNRITGNHFHFNFFKFISDLFEPLFKFLEYTNALKFNNAKQAISGNSNDGYFLDISLLC